jgi:hypothetical protein
MPISETSADAIVKGRTTVSLSQFFTVTGTANPAYLVVCALDRNEYTAAANGDTGSFSGNGHTLALSSTGSDGRGAGIVYTWNATTGQYVNATYGALSALTYTSSDSVHDMTNISLFETTSQSIAQSYASDAYSLMQADASGYAGSACVVTDPTFSGTPPSQATPNGIAAVAQSYVGDAWNMDGCWVLASTIAAEAGAALPVQSTALEIPGMGNGEWMVAYNGPVSSRSNWQSLVHTGDIVAFVPAGGGGHITTCVSGSGSTAQLIDNITYENSNGSIANSANDGSSSDIVVEAPHAASQEFNGANPADVVIYQLDTPIVTTAASASALTGTALALSSLISAADPAAGKSITEYQLYDSAKGASFGVAGTSVTAQSASAAITVKTLSSLTLSYAAAGTDTVDARAFNGTYWGDWQTLTVTVAAFTASAPKLGTPTAAQTWLQGSKVSLTLPSALFTDPQKQALTYTATGASGASLPSWLSFNPATRTFSGTVPKGMTSFPITVTATDTSGLSTSETFTAAVPAAAPTLALTTPALVLAEGSSFTDTLPSGTFADPQGQALTLKAAMSNGATLPSWLSFNAATGTFSGTAPATAQSLLIKLTATDTSNLSMSETFALTVAKSAAHAFGVSDWSSATPAASTQPHLAGGFVGISAGLDNLHHADLALAGFGHHMHSSL